MPFGEIVSTLRADLAPLEQDLKKAEERIRAYLGRVNRLHAQVASGGAMAGFAAGGHLPVIGAGGTAAQTVDKTVAAAERAERRMRQLNVQAEAEYRRLLAARDAAYKEDERRRVAAAKRAADAEKKSLNSEAAERKLRQANDAAERDFRRLMAAREAAYKEEENRRLAAIKAVAAAEKRELAGEAAERRLRQANEAAERDLRRLMAARAAAYKEDEQQRVAAAKRAAAEEKRVQEQALAFYRRRAGLGAVGGGPAPGPGGGPGSFLTPSSMRGLDEANSKWLKQQQSIAAASTLTERLSQQFKRMGEHDLNALIEGSKQFANWLGVGIVGAATAAGVAFAKYALDTDTFFERSKVTIAEVLALTTKVVDKQGHLVDYAKQQNLNYALSAKLIENIRTASIRTSLPAQTLANVFARTLGFAVGAGATPQQAVPVIAQVTNLARALGSRSEREFGFENRALFTGQNITRSRIGQALSLTRQDIEKARETGTLIQFLTDRLKAGQPYLDRWATSWDGLVTTFQTKFQTFVHTATGELYDRIREQLAKINQSFDPETIERWGKAFSDYLLKAWDRAQAIFESDGFKRGVELFKLLAAHSLQIVEAVGAFKALEGLTRVAGVISRLYDLTKLLGVGAGARSIGQSVTGLAARAAVSTGVQTGVQGLAGRFMTGFKEAGLPQNLPANQVSEGGITRAFGQGSAVVAEAGLFSRLSAGLGSIIPTAEAVSAALPPIGVGLAVFADAVGAASLALLAFQKHAADIDAKRTESDTRTMIAHAETNRIARSMARLDAPYVNPHPAGIDIALAPEAQQKQFQDRVKARRDAQARLDAARDQLGVSNTLGDQQTNLSTLLSPMSRDRMSKNDAATEFREAKAHADYTVYLEKEAQDKIYKAAVAQQIRIGGVEREQYERRAITNKENLEKRRKAELELDAFVHRTLARGTEDEKLQLQEREKADEDTIRKRLGETKKAHDLIAKLQVHLNDKLQDLDRDHLLNYQKMLAQMSGSKAAQLEQDYRNNLKSIEDGNFSDAEQARLRKEALAKRGRDLQEERTNERLAAMDFQANVTGDELKQISLRNARELLDRYKQIGQDTLLYRTANEKKLAYQQAFNQEYAKTERERLEKVKEFSQRATDLQRQAFDQQANFHKARVSAEREYQELQQKTAKELRDLMRERKDAQRELQRAQEDLPQNRENIQLNRQQRGIRHQIEQEFLSVANPNSLSGAATLEQRTKIRQLASQLASGDVFSSQQALQEAGKLGYLNQYNAPNIRGLSRQSAEIGLRREDIADQEAERGENRQMEDTDRSIEEMKRRASDLDQRQAEIMKSYSDSSAAIRENLVKTVIDAGDSMKKLNADILKLRETFRASNLPVPAALAGLAQQAAATSAGSGRPSVYQLPDGTFTNRPSVTRGPQGGADSVSQQAAPTMNFIFNGAEFKNLPQDAQEAAGVVAQAMLDLSRRTRPTTR